MVICSIFFSSCDKDGAPKYQQPSPPPGNPFKLIFKIHFDSSLARLDNFGNSSGIAPGNAAQSPNYRNASVHYIELSPDSLSQIGDGYTPYTGSETSNGGTNAVDFSQALISRENEIIYETPLSTIVPGIYKWIRLSIPYQNYDIKFFSNGIDYFGTLASFIGPETYITNFNINTQNITVNSNKTKGYWAFEAAGITSEGQAQITTIPNPMDNILTMPVENNIISGRFPTDLVIKGNETKDVTIHINLSTNKSFEWKDLNGNGLYEPSNGTLPGDTIVNIGLRGLFPTWN